MTQWIARLWKFLTYDIWRITESEVTKRTFSLYTIIKTIVLCLKRFTKDRLVSKASALTYSTLLALVPILAILFAIARGFGFSALMENEIRHGLGGGQEQTLGLLLRFVDSYLSQTRSSGLFVGIGLVMLFWTVLNLISNIETTFNKIWQVKKSRTPYRMLTDYFSMFLLLPVLLVVSSGLSIFMNTMLKDIEGYALLAPFVKFLIRLVPFVFTWLMLTGLYIFMPNTKVKFKPALISGILAGTMFQAFQFLYISSQLGVSRYNAVYGSFAALPLLLLWLQISWTICLFGAQLTYAGQNIRNFSFEQDTQNISRRYRDFICILILSLIAKRFERGESPYSAEELSTGCRIPIRLTTQTICLLQEIQLLHEVADNDEGISCYQPSVDIGKLSVAMLLDRIDCKGSEDFKIDRKEAFSKQWNVLLDAREEYYKKAGNVLLKDL
ncbi:MAG: YihY/virulence factor BrkB family protein [Prevotellaceae bacterium]|jgi:membrane protein|nr:YihY/virulence factor BrkB family protein [Prevotellaceae bacterium]